MKRIGLLLLTLALLIPAGASSTLAAGINTSPDRVIPWVGSEANQASYWVDYFARPGREVTCRKVDRGGTVTIYGNPKRLVVKNDQHNYIWFKPSPGQYASPKGVSHYFVCNWKQQQKRVSATARFFGPYGDPWYRTVVRNTGDVAIRVTWSWVGRDGREYRRQIIGPGCTWTPGYRWVKGDTRMWVQMNQPKSRRLRTITSAPPGYYGRIPFRPAVVMRCPA
mgnify:CR=1 FL=1